MKGPSYKYQSVLLIDDNELDNFINQKTIEAAHFAKHVYVNTSGRSAIEFINNLSRISAGREAFPELVFLDINMPAMDGFQFLTSYADQIRQIAPQTKFVILTSSLSPSDEEQARRMPGDIRFVRKPLNTEILSSL
jgi:CheY-like chemotaxis protein